MKKSAHKRERAAAAASVSPPQQQDGSDLMQALLAKDVIGTAAKPTPIFGIVVGQVQSIFPDGRVRLQLPQLAIAAVDARVACAPDGLLPGAAVAVMFEQGDVNRALVIGPMYAGPAVAAAVANEAGVDVTETSQAQPEYARIVIEAGEELELRCGESAIVLTADGRILQRGTYISSHASATQRIRGGSVQIN
jgi:hypothetical protein